MSRENNNPRTVFELITEKLYKFWLWVGRKPLTTEPIKQNKIFVKIILQLRAC
jgi:hypothetical protein